MRAEIRVYTLRVGVRFVDTWKPQLEAVSTFLKKEGLRVGEIGRETKGRSRFAYRLAVDEASSVVRLIKEILPLCSKKSEDLRIALDYFEDRITGAEAILRFGEQIKIGRRRGRVRYANIPWTRSTGQRLHELNNAKVAREAHTVKVSPKVKKAIRDDRERLGFSFGRLQKKYGYSHGVLRRILHE